VPFSKAQAGNLERAINNYMDNPEAARAFIESRQSLHHVESAESEDALPDSPTALPMRQHYQDTLVQGELYDPFRTTSHQSDAHPGWENSKLAKLFEPPRVISCASPAAMF
jgi:hypothetical protein